MRRVVILVMLLGGGCGSKKSEEARVAEEAPSRAAEVAEGGAQRVRDETSDAAVPPPPPVVQFTLPDVVGLPTFLAGFKANAKKVDLAEPLATLVVDDTPRDGADVLFRQGEHGVPFYRTPVPGLFVQLRFSGGRFVGATFSSADPDLIARATQKWGSGEPARDEVTEILYGPGSKPEGRKWRSAATGWEAEQFTFTASEKKREPRGGEAPYGMPDIYFGGPPKSYGVLRIQVANAVVAGKQVTAERDSSSVDAALGAVPDAKVFPLVQSLLGLSLEAAAQKIHGTIETADDTIEAGGDKQVNAYLDVSWSATPWQITLSLGRDGKVGAAYVTGDLGTDEQRVILMTALQASFGAPGAVISPEGRVVLGFPRMGKRLEVIDGESAFEITLTR